jgi:hypothetical protein
VDLTSYNSEIIFNLSFHHFCLEHIFLIIVAPLHFSSQTTCCDVMMAMGRLIYDSFLSPYLNISSNMQAIQLHNGGYVRVGEMIKYYRNFHHRYDDVMPHSVKYPIYATQRNSNNRRHSILIDSRCSIKPSTPFIKIPSSTHINIL